MGKEYENVKRNMIGIRGPDSSGSGQGTVMHSFEYVN
jgi:hypothetical protein